MIRLFNRHPVDSFFQCTKAGCQSLLQTEVDKIKLRLKLINSNLEARVINRSVQPAQRLPVKHRKLIFKRLSFQNTIRNLAFLLRCIFFKFFP
jgi:hypothetical protein